MLILSNCLTEKTDEGCLKVVNSLAKRIVREDPDAYVISYERQSSLSNLHLNLNKLLLSKTLYKTIRKQNEPVLYMPFPAKEWATALRVFLLSRVCKKKLTVLLVMLCKCSGIWQLLFRLSGAQIVTLSQSTKPVYEAMVGERNVKYLKTGVDIERFLPVSVEKQRTLKEKYGLSPDRPVVLHVGHLKQGRNIAELMKIDSQYQVLLIVSTLTLDEQDELLRKELLKRPNIKILDTYLPNIEEAYQLSDVYFFPVVAKGNCIDVPLSCMEAASCNKPVVTTRYGEMQSFEGKNGFFFIDSFDADVLNQAVSSAAELKTFSVREHVLEYDWNNALTYFSGLK